MIGARKAALKLQGLPAEDRKWILKQLPASQRMSVEQALRQLKEMGGDAIQFEDVMRIDAEETPSKFAMEHAINQVEYQLVADRLNSLSDTMLLVFLRSNIWEGSARYRESQTEDRFKRLRNLEESSYGRPAKAVEIAVAGYVLTATGR